MANILEFLRGLLTNADEQQRFAGNPHGYVTSHGFADLSGEDVTEAIRFVYRSLPDDLAQRLSVYEGDSGELPPVRPQVGESALDAAVRQLQFAVAISPAEGEPAHDESAAEPEMTFEPAAEETPFGDEDEDEDVVAPTAEDEDVPDWLADELRNQPEPEPEPEPYVPEETFETQPEPEPEPVVAYQPEPEPEPEPEETFETQPFEPVTYERPRYDAPLNEPTYSSSVSAETPARTGSSSDPYAAFGEELTSIIRHAGDQMDEVLRRADQQAETIMHSAEREGQAIRDQAEQEANSMRAAASEEANVIRAAAQLDGQNMRQTATQEADAILQAAKSAREEARIFKQSARDEANAILQNARNTQEEAQRQSADLVKSAERESTAVLDEARARRDEIRVAERELRKRLEGVESVFRTLQEGSVIPDDPSES